MIAIDTNVLLRALVDDEAAPEQSAAARRLIEQAGSVSVGMVVFLETIWTLGRSYGYSRPQVARVAKLLLEHPKYHVQSSELFAVAVAQYERSAIDFSDAVALHEARRSAALLYTFDRKLARHEGARHAGV